MDIDDENQEPTPEQVQQVRDNISRMINKQIELTQEWSEDENGEWAGSGWGEPEGYELLTVTDTDKHRHPTKAIFASQPPVVNLLTPKTDMAAVEGLPDDKGIESEADDYRENNEDIGTSGCFAFIHGAEWMRTKAAEILAAKDTEINRLKQAGGKVDHDVTQSLGAALNYPVLNGLIETGEHNAVTIADAAAQEIYALRKRIAELTKPLPPDEKIITGMCVTFRHDYGITKQHESDFGSGMMQDEKDFLYGKMQQVWENDIKPLVKYSH